MAKEQIDSRKLLELLAAGPPQGLQVAELTAALGFGRESRSQLRRLLETMVRSGEVEKLGRRYIKGIDRAPSAEERIEGVLSVTPSGYGYVDYDQAYEGVRVEAHDFAGAIDGDRVAVALGGQSRGRSSGRVERILQRGRTRVVGKVAGPPWRIDLDDPRLASLPIQFADQDAAGLAAGKLALCEIVGYPEHTGDPLLVTPHKLLDDADSLPSAVARLHWEFGIPEAFPPVVAAAGERAPAEVHAAEHAGRADLRELAFLTIDPEMARDFDDAVYVERREEGGYRLWVAVADVSHYVQEDSPLDVEARLRSCSLYPPGGVIPMLPEPLSGGICSLKPEVERLAMVVRLTLSAKGVCEQQEAMAALIRSRAQLDYTSVALALEGDLRGKRQRYAPFLEQLRLLDELAQLLREQRRRRGSLLELDLPEAKVVLDEDDPSRVRDIVESRRDPAVRQAYQLIEELMIAANEAVGRIFLANETPTLWRVHAPPLPDAVARLAGQLEHYGLSFLPETLCEPRGMAKLLAKLEGHPAQRSLAYLALRALKQAEYRAVHGTHFGLASAAYLHFTSPIRRYPDLQVHRLLKAQLSAAGKHCGRFRGLRQGGVEALARIASEASLAERRAMEAERALASLYAAAMMRDRIGDSFEGRILGFANFGIFVGIDEPFVEGMVPLECFDEFIEFDPERMAMAGRTVRMYLGDSLEVQVAGASLERRRIDLVLEGFSDRRGRVADRLRAGGRAGLRTPRGKGRPAKAAKDARGGALPRKRRGR